MQIIDNLIGTANETVCDQKSSFSIYISEWTDTYHQNSDFHLHFMHDTIPIHVFELTVLACKGEPITRIMFVLYITFG